MTAAPLDSIPRGGCDPVIDVDEWVRMLLRHQVKLVLEGGISIASDKANVCKCANFVRGSASALFVALQEVAELCVVQTFLFFDWHDVL